MFNPPAQAEPNSGFKTAKMDDSKPVEAEIVAASTSEDGPICSGFNDDLHKMTNNDKLLPKENKAQSGEGAKAGDESMAGLQMQNSLPTGQPPSETIPDKSTCMPREQYIPLVELMQPPRKPAPQRPPPPAKPRKATIKGHKGKGCYHQLAESLAVELQAINEKLVNEKLRPLEVSQVKEAGDVQELPGLEEDSYVFVSQQGDD